MRRAAARPTARSATSTTAAWDAILRVNLTAPMWCAAAAIPHMQRAGHGSIVNISSRQAERASRGFAAYIAASRGSTALTRARSRSTTPTTAIRCNTISPGYVLNDRRDADITPERRARYEGMHLTRLGVADDVAHAAVYLASRERSSSPASTCSSTAAAAPPAGSRSGERRMHPRRA